jgi:myb proto-oncogene protein
MHWRNYGGSEWYPRIDLGLDTGRTGCWTPEDDNKLKDAVETRKGKDWEAVAALVPGRTNLQCWKRWHDELDPSIDRMARRNGRRTAEEHTKLKDAVQTSYSKKWEAVAALLPGRTGRQCANR